MSSTAVFIDGGYFYDGVRGRGLSLELNYAAFVRMLAPSEVSASTFYLSLIPEGCYPARSEYDRRLLKTVADQGLAVREGRTEVIRSIFVERGLEGLISTDIVRAAHNPDIDTILIISRRADLVPAVEAAQAAGKTVQVAYFVNTFEPTPTELSDAADVFREITSQEIVQATLANSIL